MKSLGQKIVIIGCGNVAWHLAKQFHSLKDVSLFIYNHQPNSALKDFKSTLNCFTQDNLLSIIDNADFYFICVPDKFIAAVSKKIICSKSDAVIMHTSGSMALKEIKTNHKNKGVFYPLQTFSKTDFVNWVEIPLLLETNNSITRFLITRLAKQVSPIYLFLKNKQRLRFHLAAVIVNNFTNALFASALEVLNNKQSDFKLLMPLIRQTTKKVEKLAPRAAQTGPAKRNDKIVIKKHLAILTKDAEMSKIYSELSKLITKQQLHD